MNDTNNVSDPGILESKEIRRYNHHINLPAIGVKGQEKIKSAKVLVIGAGGKGTSVLQNIAAAGIGSVGICDNFAVQEETLYKQYLYGDGDLGKQRAIISKSKLHEINSLINYELHNVFLNVQNCKTICNDYDLLIDTTDNFSTRYLISDMAILLGKPTIFGLISYPYGMVSVFNYMNGPSFRCLFPAVPELNNPSNATEVASPISLISIVGAIIANETIKIITGSESLLSGNLLKFNAFNYTITIEPITKNQNNFR